MASTSPTVQPAGEWATLRAGHLLTLLAKFSFSHHKRFQQESITLMSGQRQDAQWHYTESLWSSAIPFLDDPFRQTDFGKRSFSHSALTSWNYLPHSVVICESVVKSRLKTHLFNIAWASSYRSSPVSPAPLKLWHYGALVYTKVLLGILSSSSTSS